MQATDWEEILAVHATNNKLVPNCWTECEEEGEEEGEGGREVGYLSCKFWKVSYFHYCWGVESYSKVKAVVRVYESL